MSDPNFNVWNGLSDSQRWVSWCEACDQLAEAGAELAALRAERDNFQRTASVAMETNALLQRDAAALRARIADLSMLVKRLVFLAPPDKRSEALDYLKRHQLEGSPLRDDPSAADAQICVQCRGSGGVWGESGEHYECENCNASGFVTAPRQGTGHE